jgi:hypothetical protein
LREVGGNERQQTFWRSGYEQLANCLLGRDTVQSAGASKFRMNVREFEVILFRSRKYVIMTSLWRLEVYVPLSATEWNERL